jgi:hypothetical protein
MALAASPELILFYWDLGAMIAQLSSDLQKAFPRSRACQPPA